jgi:hypothetical protein
MTIAVSSAVGIDEVPETMQQLTTMPRVDYADSYTATIARAQDSSPEEWTRAVLEDTALGHQARRLWQVLGLRLGPPGSRDHVQGWRIAGSGDDWIRLEASSWWATAQAVCHVEADLVSLAVFLRYRHPMGALIWRPVSVMHQRAVPMLLQQARKRGDQGGHRVTNRRLGDRLAASES